MFMLLDAGRASLKLTAFSPGKVTILAESLAQRIATRYPPVIANTPEPMVSQERVEEILDSVLSGELKGRNRPGIVARATLAYAFRRRLRESGYDDEFVEFAAKKLGQRLNRPDA